MTETASREPAHVRQARYLGADAALAAASWLTMSEDDAASIVDDVDPMVVDRYREPNLSGEFADDPTPVSIAHDVGANDGDIAFWGPDLLDAIATAWTDGVGRVWSDIVRSAALHTLGRTDEARAVESEAHALADRLRREANDLPAADTTPRHYWAHYRTQAEADAFIAAWAVETGYRFTIERTTQDGRESFSVRREDEDDHHTRR